MDTPENVDIDEDAIRIKGYRHTLTLARTECDDGWVIVIENGGIDTGTVACSLTDKETHLLIRHLQDHTQPVS